MRWSMGVSGLAAGALLAGSAAAAPACRASQMRLSVDGKDGAFTGMSHDGVELSLRNLGRDCVLPALPVVSFLDARGRRLAAVRRAPPGMHPGPAMVPVRVGGGHRAAAGVRWISGPVFARNRALRVARVAVRLEGGTVSARLKAVIHGEAGKAASFEQQPLRAMEGMAAG